MKYYKLVEGHEGKYGYFQKDTIYPENARTDDGFPLLACLTNEPDDWEEVFVFKFGKGYIYE